MKKSIIFISGMLAASICFAEEGTTATEAASATAEASSTATEAIAKPGGEVARSAFTTMIDDREPVDSVEQIPTDDNKIMFFTELTGMSGHKAIHRWMHNDEIMAEIGFNVGGDRWRVWSSKNLSPELKGLWTVEVLDDQGNILKTSNFTYGSQ